MIRRLLAKAAEALGREIAREVDSWDRCTESTRAGRRCKAFAVDGGRCTQHAARHDDSPPCCLCNGLGALLGDEGPFSCPCTPRGRERLNGEPDHVVRARIEAA